MKEAPGATGVTATAGCAGRRGLAGLRLSSSQLYTLLAVTLAGMALPAIFAPKLVSRWWKGFSCHLLQLVVFCCGQCPAYTANTLVGDQQLCSLMGHAWLPRAWRTISAARCLLPTAYPPPHLTPEPPWRPDASATMLLLCRWRECCLAARPIPWRTSTSTFSSLTLARCWPLRPPPLHWRRQPARTCCTPSPQASAE